MSNLKLGVEVISTHNLLPKDGQASLNAFVELQFDGQKFRTAVKEKDLDPVWNETFYFNISNLDELANESLEAYIYSNNVMNQSKSSLGKVKIACVPYSDAVVFRYPLEKGSVCSRSRGELGLKVYITDDPYVRSSISLPGMDSSSSYINSHSTEAQSLESLSKGEKGSGQTFHHLSNETQQRISSYISSYGVDVRTNASKMVHTYSSLSSQADEAYPDAWHSDAASSFDSSVPQTLIRSKVYHSPRLWYVRVNVIELQDLIVDEQNRFPDLYVKVQIGHQVLKTRHVQTRTANALWNEDLLFVAAEPFEDHLILSVGDRFGHNKDKVLGKVFIPLDTVERRVDDRIVHSQWFNLQNPSATDIKETKKDKEFATRLHLRVSLDGGYHVLDESTHYSSDLRPTAKQLWKPSIGVLELGILNADGLHPMKTRDGRGTSDTYCVAKYGHEWIRTRTVVDSLNPRYNEQYTWEVFDPSTVLTIGVFDSNHGSKDMRIGNVRVRISTLETGHVYTHSYPLLVLYPSGVKKMGELHLAIRFSCTSMANMMFQYSKPLLPKMHYSRPLTVMQLEMLRHQAVNIVAARLSRSEPPIKREVVEYMTYAESADSHLWSMRRSKANFFRLMSVSNGLLVVWKWFEEVCTWKNPFTTGLVHVLFLMLVCFPELILSTVFLYMFAIGIWNYRLRPRYPPHMNTRVSYADSVHPDELDEEFDTFPTSRSPELVRMRYDLLRSVAGWIQTVVGDVATQGERIQALLSWRDPRATFIFVTSCLVASIVFYVTPFQVLAVMAGFYVMRHPRFRHKLPAAALNFFRRLPARTDSML